MTETSNDNDHRSEHLHSLIQLLNEGTIARVERELHELHPAEIAHLLEALPHEQRDAVWELV
ncbi:MAG: magnesium transporter, partial [Gammaproteobacteria bacterium]|nr:magnesium transporter [Gammaproteobacteria bacterium]